MIPNPQQRRFWHHMRFALVVTGLLLCVFWVEASDRVGWGDAALAFGGALLLVLAIILVGRQRDKAVWVDQPTWGTKVLFGLAGILLGLGLLYADAYLLHRRDLTATRFSHDILLGAIALLVPAFAALLSELRKRSHPQD